MCYFVLLLGGVADELLSCLEVAAGLAWPVTRTAARWSSGRGLESCSDKLVFEVFVSFEGYHETVCC